MRQVRGLAVEVEAWRYADGSEAKAKAETRSIGEMVYYTTVGVKREVTVCQVVKVAHFDIFAR